MQYLLPLILIGLSGALFLTWIDPTYGKITALQEENQSYDEALAKTAEIREFRQNIQADFNSIRTSDFDRLSKVLPPHIDNIQLILDINQIAAKNGMTIRDVRIDRRDGATEGGRDTIQTESEGLFDTVQFSFSVVSTYENFKRFLDDLAISLRIIDVTSVAISEISGEESFYRYDVGIKTYWLEAPEDIE